MVNHGCGKSTLIRKSKTEFENGNVVIINGDEYRRYHPKSKEILGKSEEDYAFYTDADVRTWTSDIFEYATDNRYNVIFEGTMRTNRICDTIKRLKEKGYRIEVKALAVNGIDSIISTMERYERQVNSDGHGRRTTSESHRAAYIGMLDTLEEIERQGFCDSIEVLTRNEDVIYSKNDNGVYSKFNSCIKESIIRSREEQKPSNVDILRRIDAISKSRVARGKCKIEVESLTKELSEEYR